LCGNVDGASCRFVADARGDDLEIKSGKTLLEVIAKIRVWLECIDFEPGVVPEKRARIVPLVRSNVEENPAPLTPAPCQHRREEGREPLVQPLLAIAAVLSVPKPHPVEAGAQECF